MAASLKKLLIGTSVAVGISTIASLPAKAASFDFDNSETNYATYTNQDGNLWIKNNEAAAISALTDGDLTTNVELNYNSEKNDASVGFTVTAGKYTAKVSSVTTEEFNTFQDQWLNGLLNAYQPLQTVWKNLTEPFQTLAVNAFKSSVGFGDPNIAEFSLDETGAMSMKTMGFFDLKPKLNETSQKLTAAKDALKKVNKSIQDITNNTQYKSLSGMKPEKLNDTQKKTLAEFNTNLSGLKANKTDLTIAISQLTEAQQVLEPLINTLNGINLQISEITKVELNGVSEYVYSFNAEQSGFAAKDDGKSYTGVYSWSKAGTPVAVPEPSTILGLMAIGGLFGAAKRKNHS